MDIEKIMEQYSTKLLRYATSILYNHQDAEDVVQDVFITAFEKQDKFDGSNISAWLYKITYNKSINKLKRNKFLIFGQTLPEDTVTPEYTGLDQNVLEAMKILKPEDRALLYGKIVEGYTYEELSEQMGKTSASLRKRYERAKKQVATYLTKLDPETYGAMERG